MAQFPATDTRVHTYAQCCMEQSASVAEAAYSTGTTHMEYIHAAHWFSSIKSDQDMHRWYEQIAMEVG